MFVHINHFTHTHYIAVNKRSAHAHCPSFSLCLLTHPIQPYDLQMQHNVASNRVSDHKKSEKHEKKKGRSKKGGEGAREVSARPSAAALKNEV